MINRLNYIIPEIPKLIPQSQDYKQFWSEQNDMCINGQWSGGRWIPGTLHWFLNMWLIEIKKDVYDKFPIIGRPLYRDVEDEIHYAYAEARGFSRFSNLTAEQIKGMTPRDIMIHPWGSSAGRPLYENPARNMVLVTGRGGGKSYNFSSIIAYEYTFVNNIELTGKGKKEVLVGAYDSKFSDDLLAKVRFGMESLPGGIEMNGVYYPPPFSKRYRGSWESGKKIEARYMIYKGRHKIAKGDRSTIHHRVFGKNSQAGVGTRPSLVVLEESGAFNNLESSVNATIQACRNGTVQFGTIVAIGTGGDMDAGSIDLSRMFNEPEAHNCVSIVDRWEQKGSIGIFVPATMCMNEFKNENGDTDEDKAMDTILGIRTKMVEDGATKDAIEKEMMYRPIVPSEVFMTSSGNIFPRKQLQHHLAYIENNDYLKHRGQNGRLEFNGKTGKMDWIIDKSLRNITSFPLRNGESTEGCITIYEHPYIDPEGKTPPMLYIAGIDPYDQDQAENSPSLLACYIYKRFFAMDESYDMIVAEYVGRPELAEQAYENVRRLLMYYNARALYENMVKGLHTYMRHKQCDHLLVSTPDIIHDIIKDTTVNRGKGIHMALPIKQWCERLTKSWLMEEFAPGKMNLEKILSEGLLRELLAYNSEKGNYDRVIALFMVLLLNQSMYQIQVKETKEKAKKEFFLNPGMFSRKPDLMS